MTTLLKQVTELKEKAHGEYLKFSTLRSGAVPAKTAEGRLLAKYRADAARKAYNVYCAAVTDVEEIESIFDMEA